MRREEQIVRAFYQEAKADLIVAELTYENGIYSRCVSSSQQVIEKVLKSALAASGTFGLMEHEVSDHFAKSYKTIADDEIINRIVKLAKPVESEWIRSRYPNWTDKKRPIWIPSQQYDKNKDKNALSSAKEIYNLIKHILKSKFDLEFEE